MVEANTGDNAGDNAENTIIAEEEILIAPMAAPNDAP
jgi:hypothetical protein